MIEECEEICKEAEQASEGRVETDDDLSSYAIGDYTRKSKRTGLFRTSPDEKHFSSYASSTSCSQYNAYSHVDFSFIAPSCPPIIGGFVRMPVEQKDPEVKIEMKDPLIKQAIKDPFSTHSIRDPPGNSGCAIKEPFSKSEPLLASDDCNKCKSDKPCPPKPCEKDPCDPCAKKEKPKCPKKEPPCGCKKEAPSPCDPCKPSPCAESGGSCRTPSCGEPKPCCPKPKESSPCCPPKPCDPCAKPDDGCGSTSKCCPQSLVIPAGVARHRRNLSPFAVRGPPNNQSHCLVNRFHLRTAVSL